MLVDLCNLDEIRARLQALRGGKALVNHFATWCEPCVEEIPLLVELRRRSAAPFLAVSWELFMGWEEAEEARERLEAWAPSVGLDFPILLYTGEPQALIDALGISTGTIPHTVVLGSDGSEVLAVARPLDPQDLPILEQALS